MIEPSADSHDHVHPGRHYQGRKRRISTNSSAQLRKYASRILISLLLLASMVILFDPFSLYTIILNTLVTHPLPSFIHMENSAVLGGIFLSLAVTGGFAKLHKRILHHADWWDRSCPKCDQLQLRRIHRRWYDYLLGHLGIPVLRYFCRHCRWRGLLIDQTRV